MANSDKASDKRPFWQIGGARAGYGDTVDVKKDSNTKSNKDNVKGAPATRWLREKVEQNSSVDLVNAVERSYDQEAKIIKDGGYGNNAKLVLGGVTQVGRLVTRGLAGQIEGPLNKTLQNGLVDNPELWRGLAKLENAGRTAGLPEAVKSVASDVAPILQGEGALDIASMKAAAAARRFVVPAINESKPVRDAFADVIALVIAKYAKDLQETTGLDPDAVKDVLRQAMITAENMRETGEGISAQQAARNLAGELLAYTAGKVKNGPSQ